MTQFYELSITADTNDADYVTRTTKVTMDTIEKLKPIIEIVKNCEEYHNWPNGEIGQVSDSYPNGELSADDKELMEEYLPYGEYGIHTITTIEYYPYPEKITLL